MYNKLKASFFSAVVICMLTGTLVSFKSICQPIPSFKMQLSNGKIFSSQNLSPAKPLILIYFAPDCEHCQLLMDAIFKRINQFKKAQLVLVTFKPLNELLNFENHYSTHKYQNIKTGTESPIFFFRKYYDLQSTPFTALYNSKGKLVISYKKETLVDDLIKHLKQLN